MLESITISRCSLVVRALDGWTGRLVSGPELEVRLQNSMSKPLRTSEGSWAFLDMRSTRCVVIIVSHMYHACSQEIDLTLLSPVWPVVTICLQPGRNYKPPAGATGLMFRITDGQDKPLPGVEAVAYADDDQAARGRIHGGEPPAGCKELHYLPGAVTLIDGDMLALRDKEGILSEAFRVFPVGARDEPRLLLDRPLAGSWKRNSVLLPTAATLSDQDGWIVLPFRGRMPASSSIRVKFRVMDQTNDAIWTIEGGKTTLLPDFVWNLRG